MKTILRVKNDSDGREFIETLKTHTDFRIRVRTRGPRARFARQDGVPSYDAYLPKRHATYFSIYLWRIL